MAQTKQDIQSILQQLGVGPRHRFGQNFMIDQNLVRLIALAGEIQSGQTVIEVGPGTGTLTEELLASGAHVIAVEIDRYLALMLQQRFGQSPPTSGDPSAIQSSFSLIQGDALAGKHALNAQLISAIRHARQHAPNQPIKLVANLPYNIASPLVVELLLEGIDLLAFTVQKEVADRLRAPANTEHYGPLSVIIQMLATVEVLRTLSPQAFWPPPKIDSALVRLRHADQLGDSARDFSRFVHQLFAARRKTLRKALSMAGHDLHILEQLGIDPQARPETLSPSEFHRLFQLIHSPASDC